MPGQVIYKHGWRKCSEEMPPNGWALACHKTALPFVVYYVVSGNSWLDASGQQRDPTHWQPLPPAPTEDE